MYMWYKQGFSSSSPATSTECHSFHKWLIYLREHPAFHHQFSINYRPCFPTCLSNPLFIACFQVFELAGTHFAMGLTRPVASPRDPSKNQLLCVTKAGSVTYLKIHKVQSLQAAQTSVADPRGGGGGVGRGRRALRGL